MKHFPKPCRKPALICLVVLAINPSLLRAASEEAPLYKMSASEMSTEIFDHVVEREREMIYGQGSGAPPNTIRAEAGRKKGVNVVLLFDVSKSVATKSAASGLPMNRIKEEVVQLVDSLPASTRFNVVQFTRNYLPFRENSVPADEDNRKSFRDWVGSAWNDTGTLSSQIEGVRKNPEGILGLLEFAGRMDPDMIYVISDGSFEKGPKGTDDKVPWEEVRESLASISGDGKKVAISFIAFAPKDSDAREMRNIAGTSGGRFSVVQKRAR